MWESPAATMPRRLNTSASNSRRQSTMSRHRLSRDQLREYRMAHEYSVAVVGVGAVGEEILRVMAEHKFPSKSVRVLARTPRTISVDGRSYQVEATTPEAFEGVDIALFAGTEGEKGAAVTFGP